jgi:hypothetical protein
MRRALQLLAATVVAGCITPQPPPEPDLAPARAPTPTVARAPAPELPPRAECELGGEVTRPKAAKGDLHVWIADGPCWEAPTHAFAETRGGSGDRWFSEVFVPQGAQLWVCAALVDGKRPITVHGTLERSLLARGEGEVAFMGLKIPLAKGKRVSAPSPRHNN